MEACELCSDDARFLKTRDRPDFEAGSGRRVRLVDLFSSGGGLTLGIAEAARRLGRGTWIKAAVELDREAANVYETNFPNANVLVRDVRELFDGVLGEPLTAGEEQLASEIGPVDILVAGPPCQGHSDLNNHTRRNDPRNLLYLRAVRAVEVLAPQLVLIENVPTVRHDVGEAIPLATEALEDAGYSVKTDVVDLLDLGVPQRRRRHVVLASRKEVDLDAILALKISCALHGARSVDWAIRDLENIEADTGIDSPSRPTEENRKRMEYLVETGEADLPNHLRPDCHQHEDHSYISMYGRLSWDLPAQTITTGFGSMGQGRYVHPSKARTITPHEAARLQTLPDFFDLGADHRRKTWAHVIGNAVPPLLGVYLGGALLRTAFQDLSERAAPKPKRRVGVPEASSELIRIRMKNTKRRDTKPELTLRAELDRRGYEYLVDHPIDGSRRRVDVVFPEAKVAVFVNGCYWHGCSEHGTTPKSNREWWLAKIEANRVRDADTDQRLRAAGWTVLRYWEHDDLEAAAAEIVRFVELTSVPALRRTGGK